MGRRKGETVEEFKARQKVYSATPERKASKKAYRDTPEAKASQKAYSATPERKASQKAHQKAYNATPEAKVSKKAYNETPAARAIRKAYMKVYRQTPEAKASKKAYDATPEARAIRKAYDATPEAKASKKAHNATPEAFAKRRNARYLSVHGVTFDQADYLRCVVQNGKCAACHAPLGPWCGQGKHLNAMSSVLDHCHKSDGARGPRSVRGVVHSKCNVGMGFADDDAEKMRRWGKYRAKADGARPFRPLEQLQVAAAPSAAPSAVTNDDALSKPLWLKLAPDYSDGGYIQ